MPEPLWDEPDEPAVAVVEEATVVVARCLCFFLWWGFFGVVAVVVAAAVGVLVDFELLEPQPATASAAIPVITSIRFINDPLVDARRVRPG